MKQRVSLLGCGWLGFALGKVLVEAGHVVRGSTTTREKITQMTNAEIDPFLLNINRNIDGKEASRFFQSDILFLNIPYRRDFVDPQEYSQQINAIVDFAQISEIRNIVFASSTSIYPDDSENALEDRPFKLANQRAQVLWDIEQGLLKNKNFSSTIVRFAGLFGYDRKIGNFLSTGKSIPQGLAPVNLIHRDDCVEIVKRIIERNVYGEVFNAVCDEHPIKKDLYTKAAQNMNLLVPQFQDDVQKAYKIVSNQKVKSALNYTFKFPDPMKCI